METLVWMSSGAALVVAVTMALLWVWAMQRVQVGAWLSVLTMLSIAAVVLGIGALISADSTRQKVLAGLALPAPLIFLGLQLIAKQPPKRVAVRVGDPIKDFEALDGNGNVFKLSSMLDSAYLLKFYRGHW